MVNYVQITQIRTIGSNQEIGTSSSSMGQCHLKWRDKMLMVKSDRDLNSVDVIALKSDWWLLNCLQKSPIKRIRVTPNLSETEVKNWVVAGEKSGKQVFLKISSDLNIFLIHRTIAWKIKRLADLVAVSLILMLLSPFGLAIAFKRKLSGQPVLEKRWCVGKRGLIFQTFDWADNNSPSFWSRQGFRLGIHKLPQLINVMRGEMSLVGHYPFSIEETLNLNSTQRKVLNSIPGVISTTPWRSPQTDLRAISAKAYSYLCHWSLLSDLKIIFLALLRSFQAKDPVRKIVKL